MAVRVTIVLGPDAEKGMTIPITGEALVIGRGDKADMRLTSPAKRVSRQHTRIHRQNGRWMIEDLGSQNGTTVDGKALANGPQPLAFNSVVNIGEYSIHFQSDADSAEVTGTPPAMPDSPERQTRSQLATVTMPLVSGGGMAPPGDSGRVMTSQTSIMPVMFAGPELGGRMIPAPPHAMAPAIAPDGPGTSRASSGPVAAATATSATATLPKTQVGPDIGTDAGNPTGANAGLVTRPHEDSSLSDIGLEALAPEHSGQFRAPTGLTVAGRARGVQPSAGNGLSGAAQAALAGVGAFGVRPHDGPGHSSSSSSDDQPLGTIASGTIAKTAVSPVAEASVEIKPESLQQAPNPREGSSTLLRPPSLVEAATVPAEASVEIKPDEVQHARDHRWKETKSVEIKPTPTAPPKFPGRALTGPALDEPVPGGSPLTSESVILAVDASSDEQDVFELETDGRPPLEVATAKPGIAKAHGAKAAATKASAAFPTAASPTAHLPVASVADQSEELVKEITIRPGRESLGVGRWRLLAEAYRRAAAAAAEPETALAEILPPALRELRAWRAGLIVVDARGKMVVGPMVRLEAEGQITMHEAPARRAVREQTVIWMEPPGRPTPAGPAPADTQHIWVPVAFRGTVFGVLQIDRPAMRPEGELTPTGVGPVSGEPVNLASDLDFAAGLADAVAIIQETARLRRRLRLENRELRLSASLGHPMIGRSVALQKVLADAERVAVADAPVLIQGEAGTGKERLAVLIHHRSRRADEPLVRFDCVRRSAGLLECELFGYEDGSDNKWTEQRGKFELANGGTLFLDHIEELSDVAQQRLLAVLDTRTVERVGARSAVPVDVRIIAASESDLEGAVKAGKFRGDLLTRLSTLTLKVPPLRDRSEDIAELSAYYLRTFAEGIGRVPPMLSEELRRRLESLSWPGNIRQLRNGMERLAVMCQAQEITPHHCARYLPELAEWENPTVSEGLRVADLVDGESPDSGYANYAERDAPSGGQASTEASRFAAAMGGLADGRVPTAGSAVGSAPAGLMAVPPGSSGGPPYRYSPPGLGAPLAGTPLAGTPLAGAPLAGAPLAGASAAGLAARSSPAAGLQPATAAGRPGSGYVGGPIGGSSDAPARPLAQSGNGGASAAAYRPPGASVAPGPGSLPPGGRPAGGGLQTSPLQGLPNSDSSSTSQLAPGLPGGPTREPPIQSLRLRDKDTEKRQILMALDQARGSPSEAAKLLGIARGTLYRKMDQYGIRSGRSD